MLTRAGLLAAMLTLGTVGLLATTTPAYADGAAGEVRCDENHSTPGCTVKADTPGGSGSAGIGSQSSGDGQCRHPNGTVIACQTNHGWAGADGCYYRLTDPSRFTAAGMGGESDGPGAWYVKTCIGSNTASQGLVFLAAPPVASPDVLARQARSMLALPQVAISLNPSGDQLVGLPTWLVVGAASWTPQSATASVPGVSVTATATPVRAVWQMGDGSTVVCAGPGTPWRPGMDPAAVSPDCGYRYTRSSAGALGAAYAVTVSVTWDVTWAGAGQAGTVPGLTTTGVAWVRVAESQAVITR